MIKNQKTRNWKLNFRFCWFKQKCCNHIFDTKNVSKSIRHFQLLEDCDCHSLFPINYQNHEAIYIQISIIINFSFTGSYRYQIKTNIERTGKLLFKWKRSKKMREKIHIMLILLFLLLLFSKNPVMNNSWSYQERNEGLEIEIVLKI